MLCSYLDHLTSCRQKQLHNITTTLCTSKHTGCTRSKHRTTTRICQAHNSSINPTELSVGLWTRGGKYPVGTGGHLPWNPAQRFLGVQEWNAWSLLQNSCKWSVTDTTAASNTQINNKPYQSSTCIHVSALVPLPHFLSKCHVRS